MCFGETYQINSVIYYMGPIVSILVSKGLPILASALLTGVINKSSILKKIGEKIGLGDKATEKEIEEKLSQELTTEEFYALLDLQHSVQREEEATKRLEIDNNSESWITSHIRPITLGATLLISCFYFFLVSFVEISENKFDLIIFLGECLFGLTSTAFGFYFGGRSLEKISKKFSSIFNKN